MRAVRTVPPAAAPLHPEDFLGALGGLFSGRDLLRRLEDEIREYFHVSHVFLVSSGKAALVLILRGLASLSKERKEVVIPAYTCFSVPSAVVKAGLEVRLCDIDLCTLDFDYTHLESIIGETTLCVVPCHLFGIPSDLDRVKRLCKSKGVFVVEDAAQAMGGMYKGEKLGTVGDVGFFSLGRGKNITCGNGGIIVTGSETIAGAIESFYAGLERPRPETVARECVRVMGLGVFARPSLYWLPAQVPFLGLGKTIFYNDFPVTKLSSLHAALLQQWPRRLEKSNQIRSENAARLTRGMGRPVPAGAMVPYLRLPLLLSSREARDAVCALAARRGLGLSTMYPHPIDQIEGLEGRLGQTGAGGEQSAFPAAAEVSRCLLTAPTHPLLSSDDLSRLATFLAEIDPPPRIPSAAA